MSQKLLLERITPEQLLDLFIEDCRDRQLTEETIRRYRSSIKHFLDYLHKRGTSPTQVDKHILHDYIRERRQQDIEQKTLENDLTGIAGFYEYLVFEDHMRRNPVPGVRKRYLRRYKEENDGDVESPRRLLTIEQMSLLINSVIDTRDKAIMTLLAKTGVRRGELIANWTEQSITLKRSQFKKRSGRSVFFDDETARLLKRWLNHREHLKLEITALFHRRT